MRFIRFNNAIVNLDYVRNILLEDKEIRIYSNGSDFSAKFESSEEAKKRFDAIWYGVNKLEKSGVEANFSWKYDERRNDNWRLD